ncbi:MAG: glutathione synthase [Wenzhouxiangellaceae bacterium]
MSNALICVMDDLAAIKPVKDTSFALMLEAQRRGLPVWYANESDLSLSGSECHACLRRVTLTDREQDYFNIEETTQRALGTGDLVLMRSDPPVDDNYLYATLLLDRAQAHGARVVNNPRALREFNEKLSIANFPDWIPETVVSSQARPLREFIAQHRRAVLKPLDGMGGRGIFQCSTSDSNLNVIIETVTADGSRPAMAQEYLPGISKGDKRVLVVNGRVVPWMLARIPGSDDFRGNLARGGRGEGQPLGEAERRVAEAVAPILVENDIAFAGLDVIDGRLTEINITSPTCVRELDAQFDVNIAAMLFDDLLE